jgi:chromosome transmission fidelity protein 4
MQLYKTDETLDFIHIAATFQFAVRALAFSPDGTRLAAAGDDATLSIIHVNIEDESSVPHTYTIGPNTRGLSWDPEGTYLAITQSSGTLRIWDASGLNEVWMDKCAPAVRCSRLQLQTAGPRILLFVG